MILRPFVPTGRVAANFYAGRDLVGGIMGPVGSGKTSAGLAKRVSIAQEQAPAPDGLRRTKHVVIRTTTRELEKTTIPSWLEWFPRELGHFTGGSGGISARHMLVFDLPDSTRMETLVEFVGLNEHKIEDVMRGYEGTTALIDEADLLAPEAHEWVSSRMGRYPKDVLGLPSYYGIDLMFNAPDTENYCYEYYVEAPREGYQFYRQPPAVLRDGARYIENPMAENLSKLPAGWYPRQVIGKPDWMVRRLYMNDFGYSREGEPVYPEYDDVWHVAAAPMDPLDADLIIGGDAGLRAAAIIMQRDSFGQIRVLGELCAPESGMGAERFGEWLNAELAGPRYFGLKVALGMSDPYGDNRKDTDELTWRTVMQRVTKFTWRPAPTNNPGLRQEAVRGPLQRRIIAGDRAVPGLIIDPRHCPKLRKGFNGGYRFRRVQGPNSRVIYEPEKNSFSDPHDGLQYGCLALGEGDVALRGRMRQGGPRQIQAITDDSPQGAYAGGRGQRDAIMD